MHYVIYLIILFLDSCMVIIKVKVKVIKVISLQPLLIKLTKLNYNIKIFYDCFQCNRNLEKLWISQTNNAKSELIKWIQRSSRRKPFVFTKWVNFYIKVLFVINITDIMNILIFSLIEQLQLLINHFSAISYKYMYVMTKIWYSNLRHYIHIFSQYFSIDFQLVRMDPIKLSHTQAYLINYTVLQYYRYR